MAVVGLPPEKQKLSFGSIIGGAKVLAGSNIGGIAETQEMLDFCAEHGIAATDRDDPRHRGGRRL
jgi:uncharacterized zinc-type alcohol dehydrogenase-like protein